MIKYSNIIKYRLYYLSRSNLFRVYILISFLIMTFFIAFVYMNEESGQMSIYFIDNSLSQIIINTILGIFVPVYVFLYLFSCILSVEHLYNSNDVNNLLAKNISRIELFTSVSSAIMIIVVITASLGFMAYSKYKPIDFNLFISIIIFHFIILSQIKLLSAIGISNNIMLLMYLLIMLVIPVFFESIISGLSFWSGSVLLSTIVDWIFIVISSHIDLITEIGHKYENISYEINTTVYIYYLLGIYIVTWLLYNRKEFS